MPSQIHAVAVISIVLDKAAQRRTLSRSCFANSFAKTEAVCTPKPAQMFETTVVKGDERAGCCAVPCSIKSIHRKTYSLAAGYATAFGTVA